MGVRPRPGCLCCARRRAQQHYSAHLPLIPFIPNSMSSLAHARDDTRTIPRLDRSVAELPSFMEKLFQVQRGRLPGVGFQDLLHLRESLIIVASRVGC
jgi:hypothetical protein